MVSFPTHVQFDDTPRREPVVDIEEPFDVYGNAFSLGHPQTIAATSYTYLISLDVSRFLVLA